MNREEAERLGFDLDKPEDVQRFQNYLRLRDPASHQHHFEQRDPKVVLAHDADDAREHLVDAHGNARQTMRRQTTLTQVVQDALVNRVNQPTGVGTLKVSHDEYHAIYKEYLQAEAEGLRHDFAPFSKYAQNLLYYADGRPRQNPIRPLLTGEVGMMGERIVILKDNNPGDIGEGQTFVVGVDLARPGETSVSAYAEVPANGDPLIVRETK